MEDKVCKLCEGNENEDYLIHCNRCPILFHSYCINVDPWKFETDEHKEWTCPKCARLVGLLPKPKTPRISKNHKAYIEWVKAGRIGYGQHVVVCDGEVHLFDTQKGSCEFMMHTYNNKNHFDEPILTTQHGST